MTFTTREKVFGVILAIVIVWFITFFWHRDKPIVTPAVHATIDSLARTKQPDLKAIDSLAHSAQAASAAGASAAGRARGTEAAAATIRTRADAAHTEAVRTDSLASAWKLAYDLRTAERDTLLVALAQKDSAYRDASKAANDNRLALTKLTDRYNAVDNLNSSLADAVKKAERGCRILWAVPCPSRPVAAVLGATVGAVGAAVLISRRP